MRREEQPVIIKKIKKSHGGGHHGGAWKVAYADFVTAMMALFLVLWLVAMLSISAKKRMGNYFRSYTIFKGTGAGGGKGISVMRGNVVKLDSEEGDMMIGSLYKNELANSIISNVEKNLDDYKDQVLVYTTKEGVRVEIVEETGKPMFELGNATLLPSGIKTLSVVAESIKKSHNDIYIEGHTDSYKYEKEGYTNWELGADRANMVRRELIKDGVAPERIKKVISFADSVPLNNYNAYDPINRRVSILIITENKTPESLKPIRPF